MVHNLNFATKLTTKKLLFSLFYKLSIRPLDNCGSPVFSGDLNSNGANRCSGLIKSYLLPQQRFRYQNLSTGQLLSYSGYHGTVLVMFLFYSLVNNQTTTYKKIQANESVQFALLTSLVMSFLH